MEENDIQNLDQEYKRYLQILRPYLGQLVEDDVINICNAWIQRLTNCSNKEKPLRNKYIFSLCYQLSKGSLEEPFLKAPSTGSLHQAPGSLISDDSSTEVECYVVNAEDPSTEVLFNSEQMLLTDTENLSQVVDNDNKTGSQHGSDLKSCCSHSHRSTKPTMTCYKCPVVLKDFIPYDPNEVYEHRANNLIKKLRDIKTQNILLHNELCALKEETFTGHNNSFADESVIKVDQATSALLRCNDSSATVNSLKFQLQEIQDSRNSLIDKISCLQDQLDNFNEMKKHEIENIEANHKLEIINIKTAIRDEINTKHAKHLEDIKIEEKIKFDSLMEKLHKEIEIITKSKNDEIKEKYDTITAKESEIITLKNIIDELKIQLHDIFEKFIERPKSNHSGDESLNIKTEQLEKRLQRMEKNKVKYTRIYETKVAQLQREKHLTECSLQLQIVRQRAQVVNEVTDENQTELTTALDKLETKYKEIVANVQATAIQRRMQDQMALESILQAACGIPNENNNSPAANGQFPKTMRNQNPAEDGGISPLSRGNKVGHACFINKSFGDDSLVPGYCLNGERMAELFERVYIPQRDNP